MKRLYYAVWLIRLIAGAIVDLYDLFDHRRTSDD